MSGAMKDQSRQKRICIVKTSSLGDVIHTLPALTDAHRVYPEMIFDWVVEEDFKDIPAAHPAVDKVIPLALRRWRRTPIKSLVGQEFKNFRQAVKANNYDLVIDAQGLLKSGLVCSLIPASVAGLDKSSAREPVASWFYNHKFCISRNQHAVERVRQLFASALDYQIPYTDACYGIANEQQDNIGRLKENKQQIVFLHGTTWSSKHWPAQHWRTLAELIDVTDYNVIIPWGSVLERQRAEQIATGLNSVKVLPALSISELIAVFGQVSGAFSVDTGLCHLAAAMNVPMVAFYGPTDPKLTGNYGSNQQQLVSDDLDCRPCLKRTCKLLPEQGDFPPCFRVESVEAVWQQLQNLMRNAESGSEYA
jgi:heptosyltransferase-1